MGGCFFKVSSHSGFDIDSWVWPQKIPVDDAGWVRKWIFFFSKLVFWLLALLPTLRANPGTSDEDALPERGTVCTFLAGVSLIQPFTEMFTRVGPARQAVAAGVQVSIPVHASVHELCAGPLCLPAFLSTQV